MIMTMKRGFVTKMTNNENFISLGVPQFDNRLNPDILPLEEAATLADIVDEHSAKQALSMALQARKIKNQAKETKETILRPVLDYQKAVNKLVNDLNDKLESIEKRLEKKIVDWMKKEDEENIFYDCVDLQVEDGTIAKKIVWDFEIIDDQKIPLEYLEPDEFEIKEAIKSGIRNIPGIKIFQKDQYQMRVNNK